MHLRRAQDENAEDILGRSVQLHIDGVLVQVPGQFLMPPNAGIILMIPEILMRPCRSVALDGKNQGAPEFLVVCVVSVGNAEKLPVDALELIEVGQPIIDVPVFLQRAFDRRLVVRVVDCAPFLAVIVPDLQFPAGFLILAKPAFVRIIMGGIFGLMDVFGGNLEAVRIPRNQRAGIQIEVMAIIFQRVHQRIARIAVQEKRFLCAAQAGEKGCG